MGRTDADDLLLTNGQKDVVDRILQAIQSIARDNAEAQQRLAQDREAARHGDPHGGDDGHWWPDGAPNARERVGEHFNFFVVDGDRGTGKSTVVGMVRRFAKTLKTDGPAEVPVAGPGPGRGAADPEGYAHARPPIRGRDAVFALRTIYPDMFSGKDTELPDILIDQIRADLHRYDVDGEEPVAPSYLSTVDPMQDRPGRLRPGHRLRSDHEDRVTAGKLLERLRFEIDPAWTYAREVGRDVLSRDAINYREFVEHKGRYSSLASRRHLLWHDFIEAYLAFKGAETLLVTLDDCDLSPRVSAQLLSDLRLYLNHPRIVVVMAMHMGALTRTLKSQHYGQLTPMLDLLGRMGDWTPRGPQIIKVNGENVSVTAPTMADRGPDMDDLNAERRNFIKLMLNQIREEDDEVVHHLAKVLAMHRRFDTPHTAPADVDQFLMQSRPADPAQLGADLDKAALSERVIKGLTPKAQAALYFWRTRHRRTLAGLTLRDLVFMTQGANDTRLEQPDPAATPLESRLLQIGDLSYWLRQTTSFSVENERHSGALSPRDRAGAPRGFAPIVGYRDRVLSVHVSDEELDALSPLMEFVLDCLNAGTPVLYSPGTGAHTVAELACQALTGAPLSALRRFQAIGRTAPPKKEARKGWAPEGAAVGAPGAERAKDLLPCNLVSISDLRAIIRMLHRAHDALRVEKFSQEESLSPSTRIIERLAYAPMPSDVESGDFTTVITTAVNAEIDTLMMGGGDALSRTLHKLADHDSSKRIDRHEAMIAIAVRTAVQEQILDDLWTDIGPKDGAALADRALDLLGVEPGATAPVDHSGAIQATAEICREFTPGFDNGARAEAAARVVFAVEVARRAAPGDAPPPCAGIENFDLSAYAVGSNSDAATIAARADAADAALIAALDDRWSALMGEGRTPPRLDPRDAVMFAAAIADGLMHLADGEARRALARRIAERMPDLEGKPALGAPPFRDPADTRSEEERLATFKPSAFLKEVALGVQGACNAMAAPAAAPAPDAQAKEEDEARLDALEKWGGLSRDQARRLLARHAAGAADPASGTASAPDQGG